MTIIVMSECSFTGELQRKAFLPRPFCILPRVQGQLCRHCDIAPLKTLDPVFILMVKMSERWILKLEGEYVSLGWHERDDLAAGSL